MTKRYVVERRYNRPASAVLLWEFDTEDEATSYAMQTSVDGTEFTIVVYDRETRQDLLVIGDGYLAGVDPAAASRQHDTTPERYAPGTKVRVKAGYEAFVRRAYGATPRFADGAVYTVKAHTLAGGYSLAEYEVSHIPARWLEPADATSAGDDKPNSLGQLTDEEWLSRVAYIRSHWGEGKRWHWNHEHLYEGDKEIRMDNGDVCVMRDHLMELLTLIDALVAANDGGGR